MGERAGGVNNSRARCSDDDDDDDDDETRPD